MLRGWALTRSGGHSKPAAVRAVHTPAQSGSDRNICQRLTAAFCSSY